MVKHEVYVTISAECVLPFRNMVGLDYESTDDNLLGIAFGVFSRSAIYVAYFIGKSIA